MKNRVPANPGRVLITPEDGSAAFYATLTRADNPTEAGDPLSKETLLTDATAALYGLDATAVPDEVLALLSRFQSGLGNDYVWKKYHTTFDLGAAQTGITKKVARYYSSASVYYGIRYSASAEDLFNGNYKQISASKAGSASRLATIINNSDIRGKYFYTYDEETGEHVKNDSDFIGNICLYPLDADASVSDSTNGFIKLSSSRSQYPMAGYVPTDVSYVNSPDAATYPPSVDDGYEYALLGQLGAKAQIETGYYVGTGTYDSDSPCSLTLQFAPSLIIISSNAPFARNDPSCGIFVGGTTGYWAMTWEDPSYGSSPSAFVSQGTVDITDKTVSWYASSAKLQLNARGITYKYVAFG